MNTEMTFLALTVVLGFFQLFSTSMAVTKLRGVKWNLSSRDTTPVPLTGKPARMDRAFQNFKETFPLFLAAVTLVTVTGKSGGLSEACSIAYFVARLIYVPLYVFDVVFVRSLVWAVSAFSILGILVQLIL